MLLCEILKRVVEIADTPNDIDDDIDDFDDESEIPDYVSLDEFVKNHPTIRANVTMGTYTIGHQAEAVVNSGQELRQFITAFINQYVATNSVGVMRGYYSATEYVVIATDGIIANGEFDAEGDSLGSFNVIG